MKIGIVTYHRTNNYGAVMQSLATRFVLEEMGHEVYYVDYWPDYHKEKYAIFPKTKFAKMNWLRKVKFLLSLLRYYRSKKKRIDNFNKFFQTYIYPYCRPIDDYYDVVIYGSDQIWRKQVETGVYNPFYFGKNKLNTRHQVSYAASMGVIPDNVNDKLILKGYFSYLDSISVREKKLKDLVTELGYNCEQSLDPTLLLNKEKWSSLINLKPTTSEKYILYYKLLNYSFDEEAIKCFARKRNIKLITLCGSASKDTENMITTASPQQMLSLINGAEYIFTSSYHGLVFAILFHKPFYAAFKVNSERASSLLSDLNLSERLLEPKSSIPQNECAIDFSKTDRILERKRKQSLDYLAKICG